MLLLRHCYNIPAIFQQYPHIFQMPWKAERQTKPSDGSFRWFTFLHGHTRQTRVFIIWVKERTNTTAFSNTRGVVSRWQRLRATHVSIMKVKMDAIYFAQQHAVTLRALLPPWDQACFTIGGTKVNTGNIIVVKVWERIRLVNSAGPMASDLTWQGFITASYLAANLHDQMLLGASNKIGNLTILMLANHILCFSVPK